VEPSIVICDPENLTTNVEDLYASESSNSSDSEEEKGNSKRKKKRKVTRKSKDDTENIRLPQQDAKDQVSRLTKRQADKVVRNRESVARKCKGENNTSIPVLNTYEEILDFSDEILKKQSVDSMKILKDLFLTPALKFRQTFFTHKKTFIILKLSLEMKIIPVRFK